MLDADNVEEADGLMGGGVGQYVCVLPARPAGSIDQHNQVAVIGKFRQKFGKDIIGLAEKFINET